MRFRPLHERVVIRRLNVEEKTTGGIIIPDTAQEKPVEGEVVAVGHGARNEQGLRVAPDVGIGSWSASGRALRSSSTARRCLAEPPPNRL